MIILAGTIRVPAEKLADARPMLLQMVEASRAEPGCIAYSFAEDLADAGLIHIFELFRDEPARAAHSASPHMADFRAAWPALSIGERQITYYDVASAQPR